MARSDEGVKSAISSSCLYQIFIPSFTLRVLSRYFLASLPPDKEGIFGNEIFVCINPLALRALPLYGCTTQGEREMPRSVPVIEDINTSSLAVSRSITENCVSHIEERGKIAPPSAHRK